MKKFNDGGFTVLFMWGISLFPMLAIGVIFLGFFLKLLCIVVLLFTLGLILNHVQLLVLNDDKILIKTIYGVNEYQARELNFIIAPCRPGYGVTGFALTLRRDSEVLWLRSGFEKTITNIVNELSLKGVSLGTF